ncbi:MAG: universal stress protein [Nitrospirae bacterium]|nr:MAG: universal stress protein [Nitrospirota bacterium]
MNVGEDRRILLATDFSRPGELAYAYAAGLAKALHARMLILNVLEGPPGLDREFPVNTLFLKQLQEESDRELGKLGRLAEKAGITCETRQVYGKPAECVVKAAEDVMPALVVLGTHGRTGWDRLLLGSTAEAVVREAPCPVLTVRVTEANTAAQHPASPIIRRLLVPIDFSECAQEALEYAAMLAKQFGAKVCLVHAMEAAAYPLDFALFSVCEETALRDRIQRRLEELAVALKTDGVAAEVLCETGSPFDVIMRRAKAHGDRGAIVMGTHGRRGLSHLALGSVAEYVVRHAACPVLTIKSPKYRHRTKSEVRDAKQNA